LGARRRSTVAAVGELGLLARLRGLDRRHPGVEVGIGDDAAVVRCGGRRLLLTTDSLVEGVHFRWIWDGPEGHGRRAFAVNASDVAAMGGRPLFVLLSLGVPAAAAADDVERVARGVSKAARRSGCALVGEPCGEPILRSGARAGDLVYVSGTLGGAAFGREVLLGRRRGSARSTLAFRSPPSRLALGAALGRSGIASAAIDVSDGLLQDLGHVCRASRVGAVVEPDRLPYAPPLSKLPAAERLAMAVAGGEDYELAFTVPAEREPRLARLLARFPVTRIGRIVRGSGVRLAGEVSAAYRSLAAHGFDHFRAAELPRRG